MSANAQRNLCDFVLNGGTLILTHDIPRLNEKLEVCDLILRELFQQEMGSEIDRIGRHIPDGVYRAGKGKVIFRQKNLFASAEIQATFSEVLQEHAPACCGLDSDAQVWIYTHLDSGVKYYFILGLENQPKTYTVRFDEERVRIHLPAKSSAILKIKAGQLMAGVIKGLHELEKSYVSPYVELNGQTVSTDAPCDLFFYREENDATECHIENNEKSSNRGQTNEQSNDCYYEIFASSSREVKVSWGDQNGTTRFDIVQSNDLNVAE